LIKHTFYGRRRRDVFNNIIFLLSTAATSRQPEVCNIYHTALTLLNHSSGLGPGYSRLVYE